VSVVALQTDRHHVKRDVTGANPKHGRQTPHVPAAAGVVKQLWHHTVQACTKWIDGAQAHAKVALPRLVVAGEGARRPLHSRYLSAAHLLLYCTHDTHAQHGADLFSERNLLRVG
jgi:hypothetical protein